MSYLCSRTEMPGLATDMQLFKGKSNYMFDFGSEQKKCAWCKIGVQRCFMSADLLLGPSRSNKVALASLLLI